VLIIGALWAPMVLKFGQIFSYFQECWAFMAVPVAVVFMAGVLWKKVNSTAAFWTLCLSFPMLILPYLLRIFNVEMNVFNVAGIVFIIIVLFIILFTLLWKKEEPERTDFIWNLKMSSLPSEATAKGYKWYKNLVFWSIVMVAVYIFIYIVFW
jgi:SSS family solute:Na+ symporter